MRRYYEPVMGGTGDTNRGSQSQSGGGGVRPAARPRPSTARSQRAKSKLPSCSSVSAVMQASTGAHRDAGPFTPRAGGLASAASVGSLYTSSSSSSFGGGGGGVGVVKGVPPPQWANRNSFEPLLGGTASGKQSRMQAYKENRLAQGAYFSATVAGSSLVTKSHGAEPLTSSSSYFSSSSGGRPSLAQRTKKKKGSSTCSTANRPGWQRPSSGLAATKASLQRPDLEQLRSGAGGEWVWDLRGTGGGGGGGRAGSGNTVPSKYATIVQPQWDSRVKR